MNAQRFNLLLIAAIVLTLAALWAHRFLPARHLVIFEDVLPYALLYGSSLPDGSSSAYWVDERKRHWQCNSPERPKDSPFFCSFILDLGENMWGIDLSSYTHVILDVKHHGSSKKIRFYMRNFDPSYSKLNDPNSNKFNAINIDTADLSGPVKVPLEELQVADWWLLQYNIPRSNAKPDLRNIVEIAVDFESNLPAGLQDVQIKSIEFAGESISSATWYLGILFLWLGGIFLYAINQLRILRLQSSEDNRRIHRLAQQNQKLLQQSNEFRRLSTVDPLTQAFNRFGVHQIISSLTEKVPLANSPRYALILIDIDHFKSINDHRGHDAGDRVLQEVSEIIQRRIRRTDYLGRWGGEEFVVILPDTRQEFALALAEKIRLVVQDHIFEADYPLHISASFGIAQQEANEDFASTFKRVDTALYAAKNKGRNCCVLAEK